MRILVTGAAGFIGSQVVVALTARGDDVVALDCLLAESYDPQVKASNLAQLAEVRGVTTVIADLRTADLAPLVADVDAVVNEAGLPGLNGDRHGTDLYTSCNIDVVTRLVAACRESDVSHFIQVSSSSVYGHHAVGNEDIPTNPCSPYGESKLAAERVVRQAVDETGLNATILRYFSVYGPGQRPDMAYHLFCEALLDGRPLTIFGDGRQSRSNTFVTDVVDATVRALHQSPTSPVLNIAGGETITLIDAVAILADELGVTPVFEVHGPREGDQRETRGDASRAQRELGWTPQVGAEEGLRAQARWHVSGH